MLTDYINPRKPTEKEVEELMDYVLSAREIDSGVKWDKETREFERAMGEVNISGAWIAVFDNFEFTSTSDYKMKKGRLMSCVWPGFRGWCTVFIWYDDKFVELMRGSRIA